MNTNKIFGIGLSKTGTTSLAQALRILGYTTNDFPSLRYLPHQLRGIKEKELAAYTAFTDLPVVPFFEQLYNRYHNSKFIYTIRDIDSWLASCRAYPRFNKPIYQLPLKVIKLRQMVYGCISFNEEKFRKAYYQHHKRVQSYFANKTDCLLVYNICGGETWPPLCGFLNCSIPTTTFPFANAKRNNYQ